MFGPHHHAPGRSRAARDSHARRVTVPAPALSSPPPLLPAAHVRPHKPEVLAGTGLDGIVLERAGLCYGLTSAQCRGVCGCAWVTWVPVLNEAIASFRWCVVMCVCVCVCLCVCVCVCVCVCERRVSGAHGDKILAMSTQQCKSRLLMCCIARNTHSSSTGTRQVSQHGTQRAHGIVTNGEIRRQTASKSCQRQRPVEWGAMHWRGGGMNGRAWGTMKHAPTWPDTAPASRHLVTRPGAGAAGAKGQQRRPSARW